VDDVLASVREILKCRILTKDEPHCSNSRCGSNSDAESQEEGLHANLR